MQNTNYEKNNIVQLIKSAVQQNKQWTVNYSSGLAMLPWAAETRRFPHHSLPQLHDAILSECAPSTVVVISRDATMLLSGVHSVILIMAQSFRNAYPSHNFTNPASICHAADWKCHSHSTSLLKCAVLKIVIRGFLRWHNAITRAHSSLIALFLSTHLQYLFQSAYKYKMCTSTCIWIHMYIRVFEYMNFELECIITLMYTCMCTDVWCMYIWIHKHLADEEKL